MAPIEGRRNQELRQLLTDAIEVQLAAFKAGIGFWREWVEQASGFVKSASNSLREINSPQRQPRDILLEVVDAGRASIRSMTELPRNTASGFIEALDEIKKKAKKGAAGSTRSARAKTARTSRPSRAARRRGGTRRRAGRPKRAGRVKS